VATKLRVLSKLKTGELNQKKFTHTLLHTTSFLSFNPLFSSRMYNSKLTFKNCRWFIERIITSEDESPAKTRVRLESVRESAPRAREELFRLSARRDGLNDVSTGCVCHLLKYALSMFYWMPTETGHSRLVTSPSKQAKRVLGHEGSMSV
jgi:hypothetical protein